MEWNHADSENNFSGGFKDFIAGDEIKNENEGIKKRRLPIGVDIWAYFYGFYRINRGECQWTTVLIWECSEWAM